MWWWRPEMCAFSCARTALSCDRFNDFIAAEVTMMAFGRPTTQ